MNWLRKWIVAIPGRRTPLKHPPLRVPAQTLEEDLQDALLAFVLAAVFPLFVAILCISTALGQCWGKPWLQVAVVTIASLTAWLILTGLSVLSCRKALALIRNLRLGMQAERYVGQQLERCRKLGYSVFHDLISEKPRFNIDHVAIGPGGIFVVETKGRSKPERGKIGIVFDGEALTFYEGGEVRCRTREPIDQVEANAKWVRELLGRLLADRKNPVTRFARDRQMPVNPIVVYPGWYIDFAKARERGSPIAVTNDRSLIRYIRRCPERLSRQEVIELSNLLGEHLRDERRHLVEA